ncbi:unnamed protein product [Urochloa humidicola]
MAAPESGGAPVRPASPAPFCCSTSTASIDSRCDSFLRPSLDRIAPLIWICTIDIPFSIELLPPAVHPLSTKK